MTTNQLYDSKSMKKTTKKPNTPNTFYMKGEPKTQYKHAVIVDFQPEKTLGYVHQSMRQLQKQSSLIPTFNLDAKIFTPGFYIPSIEINEEHYRQKYQQKLAQNQQINLDDIMLPKPRNKDYCHVCEKKFSDYFQHSHSTQHIEELNKNKFQKRIIKLCKKYQKRMANKNKVKDNFPENESCSQSQHQQTVKKQIDHQLVIE